MRIGGVRLAALGLAVTGQLVVGLGKASAAAVTDPDDARTWQGASVGTFAQLLFGSNTLADRQAVINLGLLDDGTFDITGIGTGSYYGNIVGAAGHSVLGGGYGYVIDGVNQAGYNDHADHLDWKWVQDTGNGGASWTQGNVWDLGGPANKTVVFPIIDHGPLPQEAIEYTVYLSNNQFATALGADGSTDWVQADLKKVYLEGWDNTEVADGFTTVWTLPNDQEFRYVNLFAGGPGALQHDGDDEIDTVAGLRVNGEPTIPTGPQGPTDGVVPEPGTLALLAMGLGAFGLRARGDKQPAA